MRGARHSVLASAIVLSMAIGGTVSAGGGYGKGPYGMGYGPGMGYGGPGMGYPQRPQRPQPPKRPTPPQRPRMGMPHGYGYGYGYGGGMPMAPKSGRYGVPQPYGTPQRAAAAAPAATAPAVAAEAQETAQVSISGMRFDAPTVTVKVGGTVTWTNGEGVPHTVTANDGSFGSAQLNAGDSFEHTFTEPGTYSYYCELHPTMRATVVVVG